MMETANIKQITTFLCCIVGKRGRHGTFFIKLQDRALAKYKHVFISKEFIKIVYI